MEVYDPLVSTGESYFELTLTGVLFPLHFTAFIGDWSIVLGQPGTEFGQPYIDPCLISTDSLVKLLVIFSM